MLSIDKNLLPSAYARQFAQAQYSAPPLSYPLVVRTFKRELGREPTGVFETFEHQAAHAASIGQVHRATKDGRTYAVKVQYPGVADSLKSDLAVIKPLALQVLGLRETDVGSYFREVEARLLEETDYALELRRGTELAAACASLTEVGFPKYHPDLSSRRILTMDWIDGETMDRFSDGPAPQEDRDRIGQALWDFYDFQIHTLHQFHADPHPGNFLIAKGRLWVVDFGCTKTIDDAFYRRQFGFLDPGLVSDTARLEAALRGMNVILPSDDPPRVRTMVAICQRSLELLARPFREGRFDFGDPKFLDEIYALGEANRRDDILRQSRGERGSPHSIYVNRTFFGLYSLLARLRAVVTIRTPEWVGQPSQAT
jgi:predicted unusual protein kinase regulating ubiquinone biosynthesis (AarF/ABC1/UbiB family)